MNENADGGTVVSVATENATSVTVDDDRFEVADGNLKLKGGTTLDFESDASPIEVTITASGDGDSATHTVSVSINDVNEDFTIEAADGAVDENADGAAVGAVTITDPDAGDTHTYEVSDDRFEVAGGMLKLKDGMSLDYETDTSVIVTVTAMDGGGNSNSVDVTVTVNDVNEAPSISVADGSVDENAAGAMVGAVTASDPDAGATHTYTVSDDRFEVADGMLKLKDGMSLDHEAAGSVTVTVTVTDDGDLSASADVTVTVNNVNEAPSAPELRGFAQSVDENDEGAVIASLETGSDPEGDAVSFSVDDDRFEVIAGGVLKLKDDVSLNYEEEGGSVAIVVTAMDPSGLMSEPTIVTVEIEDENEAPSIAAADADVDENAAGAVLSAITLSDEDAGDTLTVRISDFRFTTVTDDSGGMWIALKDGESIDFEQYESVALTLRVTDDGGLSDSVDVTISVNDVNENPSVSVASGITPDGVIAASTVDENNMGAPLGKITVSDPDADDTFTLSVSDPRFEAAQDSSGGWWLKLRDDQSFDFETEESLNLTVTVTDRGGLTGTTDVLLTVRNVDEAPSAPMVRDGALSIDENDAGRAITSLADSMDPEGDDITYSVDDDRFEITSGLVLKLKDGTSLDHETEDSVTLTLTASDPAGNTSGATMVDIAVNDLNEAPTIEAADGSVDENAAGAAVGAVTASDVDDADTQTYSVSDDRFEVADGMLKLKDGESLDHETDESVVVTVTVTDKGELSASMDVTVGVNDLNEAPTIEAADGSVDENAAGAVVGAVTASDVDDADTQTYSVSDDRFEVADGMLKLKDGMSLDHETDESVMVTVTVTDSGDLSASMDVTVGVNDLNEAPTIEAADGSVDENAAGAVVGAVTASDVDDADTQTYSVSDDRFEVADGMLKLKDGVSLDYETDESVVVTVTVEDSGGLSASADVTVTVTNVDEGTPAPTVVNPDNLAVDENDAGATITSVDAVEDPEGGAVTYRVDDNRFEIDSGRVLKLRDGMSLDHEAEASVTLAITARDSTGNESEAAVVTVAVNDVNEGPDVTGSVDDITVDSGAVINVGPIDLLALFEDPDEGDAPVRYEISGNPAWLSFTVEYGEDENGNDTVHGILSGSTPFGTDSLNKLTITASDSGGESGSVSFYVVSDDGNDDITAVSLIDDAGNATLEGEVDENDASGMVFGEIRVEDQDSPEHPNGMHLIEILRGASVSESPNAPQDSRFEVRYDAAGTPWLALKAGASLDQEREQEGVVNVTIRVVDLDGAVTVTNDGPAFLGNVKHHTVTIFINDKNDAPIANAIGNWWVTAEPGQRADDVNEGDWLTFGLETGDDDLPAFTDPDGDSLTYSLSGPAWLQINATTGQITNTEGGLPVSGVHSLTVTATDPDGESASASFDLSVALSGDGDDDSADDDNEEPRFGTPNEFDYPENSGERKVATFTITDPDNGLGHHPFALDTVAITAVVNPDDAADVNNVAAVDSSNNTEGYAEVFRLSAPRKSGDTWTYDVYVRDTDQSRRDATAILDHESVDRIRITITADDGVAPAVTEEIDVRIDDVNDIPMAEAIGGTDDPNIAGGTYGVAQSEDLKEILYIKLEDIWNDDEDAADDLTFGASVSGSWIKILHGPIEWGEIEDVTWDDEDLDDDGTNDRTAVEIGIDEGEPDDNEYVLIIEIDRTGPNNGQNDVGSFTLTATDRDGGTGSREYPIFLADENLDPGPGAVTLSGSPREDVTLRASFNDDRDPDLAGDATPALVLYQWFRADDGAGTGETLVRQGTGDTYTLTQADVGKFITVKVKYYEVFENELVSIDVDTVDNEATTSRAVSNTPDEGTGSITIANPTPSTNELQVLDENVSVTDGDYPGQAVPDDALVISWQVSDNGRGGWENVTDTDVDTPALPVEDGEGKYYRAVATWDADGDATTEGDESIYSDAIQVSELSVVETTAQIEGNAFPGGTLSIGPAAVAARSSVQWQVKRGEDWVDIPGATGSLTLTQANAGQVIRALVSFHSQDDDNPGITAVIPNEANGGAPIPGDTEDSATPVAVDEYEIEASVAAPGHGFTNMAGNNLSITEMVPLASLFQDPDSARLTFAVDENTSVGLGGNSIVTGTTYVFNDSPGGVLVFEAGTGKLTFNSDVYQTHDGDNTDGDGNEISLEITASDGANTSASTAKVNLRINVAPTGITFNDAVDGNGSDITEISVEEHVGFEAPGLGGQFVAFVDVQDQNWDRHEFGTHEVTVSDDRFMVTVNDIGNESDQKGSTFLLSLKPGATLDYEAENADGDPTIVLVLTATDGGGLSTPSRPFSSPITFTVTVTNNASDDQDPPDADDVPGLKDNDGDAGNDVLEGDDDDTDGGTQPPPPGMSLGGIIENFVDNMDNFEQDLLEDFMFVIDDGIDVA